jgi:excisionase family DNA binding protein
MSYTLGEAAKSVGKSKTTLHRAIKSGRISAIKSDNGSYSIEPSELHRVFPAVTQVTPIEVFPRNDAEHQSNTLETLRIQLEMQEKERQRERDLLQETIADLREDRDKWRQQATALLEDHRPKGFLKRLLGR